MMTVESSISLPSPLCEYVKLCQQLSWMGFSFFSFPLNNILDQIILSLYILKRIELEYTFHDFTTMKRLTTFERGKGKRHTLESISTLYFEPLYWNSWLIEVRL